MTTATVTVLSDERLIREGEAAAERYMKAQRRITSMINTVVQFAEPLSRIAERIHTAYGRTQRGRKEWIEGTLELAAALAEGRSRFGSDNEFSHWLVDAKFQDISHQDRAALINMAANLPLARIMLAETQRFSWRLIWSEEMQARFTSAGKPETGEELPENAPIPIATEPELTVSPTAPPKTEVRIEPINRRHPFYGLERAEEVAACYRHGKTRSIIGAAIEKRKGIWALILQVIDAGLLVPNENVPKHPNLGILFPDAPLRFRQKYDLTKKPDFQAVVTEIMPAVLANRDAIAAAPERIEEIIRSHAQRLYADAEAARQAQRIEAAKATLKANETEVFMFGRRLWPIIDLAHPDLAYNYEELRHAVWTFRELHTATRLSSDDSPKSCGVRIRHIIKFLNGYANARVMHLLVDMSRALQTNPEGKEQLPEMPNLDRSYE